LARKVFGDRREGGTNQDFIMGAREARTATVWIPYWADDLK